MCCIVHIIEIIDIEKNYFIAVFIEKSGQTFQAAFHSWTIKSMYNKLIG